MRGAAALVTSVVVTILGPCVVSHQKQECDKNATIIIVPYAPALTGDDSVINKRPIAI